MSTTHSISADKMRDVLEVSRLLAVTPDLEVLLLEIAKATQFIMGAERASIFLYDPVMDQLWTKVAIGASEIRVPSNMGIVGSVFQSKLFLNIHDAYADERFNRDVDKRTGFKTRNLLTCPMFDLKGKAIGVIQAVNKAGGQFVEEDEQTIELLAGQAGVAVQRHYLLVDQIQIVELRREMDLARNVQESLLPKKAPKVAGLDAVGWNRCASVTGGDCYDLWKDHEDRLGIFLGDASGHGLAPALEVLQARTLTRALAEINCDPRWILTHVNQRLAKDLKLGHFVTVFLACMSSTGEVTWSSAGHGPVLFRRSPAHRVEVLEPPAPPVGVEDIFQADVTVPVTIEPGGVLVVMSDGIFEAHCGNTDLFSTQRVIELMDHHLHSTAAELLEAIKVAVRDWQKRDDPHDDQTIVIVKRV